MVSGWSVYKNQVMISILFVVCGAIHEAYTSLSSTQENTHKFILFWIPNKPNQGLYHVHSSITPLENHFWGDGDKEQGLFLETFTSI